MFVAIIAFVSALFFVTVAVMFTARFLFVSRVILYLLVAAWLAIKFVAKKILHAVPWIISAFGAVTFGLYALARQFFTDEDAKLFIAEKLTPPNTPQKKTLSLLTIGLMLELHEKLCGSDSP